MRAIVYFTITAIFWGLNFHLAKFMLNEVRFAEAGFWRYFFGVVPLFILAYKELPSLKTIQENLKGIFLVGVIGLFGFNFFFFLGLLNSPAINGALIVSTTPALTILFSTLILKTPFEKKHLLGVSISIIGVLYLILKGNIESLMQIEFSTSDILLFLSSSFFALQNVWVKKYAGNMSNKNFTFLTNLLCMLSFLFLLPFFGMENVMNYSSSFWLSAIGIGVFGTTVAYLLCNTGIKLTSANQAGIFINVVSLSTAIFSIILGEQLYSYHLISGLLIVIGVFVMQK